MFTQDSAIRRHTSHGFRLLPFAMSSQYSQLPLDDKEPVVKAQRSYILRHPVRTAILSLAAMVSLAFITGSSGQIATGCSRAFRVASKNGLHRPFSSGINRSRLPESYILPSGDKIPSVALGACILSKVTKHLKSHFCRV